MSTLGVTMCPKGAVNEFFYEAVYKRAVALRKDKTGHDGAVIFVSTHFYKEIKQQIGWWM